MHSFAKLFLATRAVVVVGVMAFVLNACGAGVESTAPASPTEPAPTRAQSQPSATGSAAPAVATPGEFTLCAPINETLRAGTDEQIVVSHPDGDMTVERTRGYTWSGSHTATDARFSGTHYYSWDGDGYTLASGDAGPELYAEGFRIENAEGAWQGEAAGVELPDGTTAAGPLVMTGEGGYKGLTAVLIWTEGSCFLDLRGIVVEFPDAPAPATSE
jgi:hypothetical protein